MPFQRVPDTAEARLRFSTSSDPDSSAWVVINVHHWRRTLGWDATDLAALNTEIAAWYNAELKPHVTDNMRLYDIQSRNLDEEFGAQATLVVNTSGTASVGQTLAMTCALVQWTCDAGAAPRRGRTFFGCLGENQVGFQAIDSAVITQLQDDYDKLRDVDVSGTAALVIVSRFENGGLRAEAVTNTIASVAVRGLVSVQKRHR
jgi:hypothetical protein